MGHFEKMNQICFVKECKDENPKRYKITFDAGNTIVNDTILLCDKCYNQPPFDKFILKVVRLKH